MKGGPGRIPYAYAALALLTLLLAGASMLFTVHFVHATQAAARQQGATVERKLCTTLGALAALQPPRGSAPANPSRGYEQALHRVLAQLGPDVGCRP